jgi:hypothetical protein
VSHIVVASVSFGLKVLNGYFPVCGAAWVASQESPAAATIESAAVDDTDAVVWEVKLASSAAPSPVVSSSDDADPLLKAYEASCKDDTIDIGMIVGVLEHICVALTAHQAETGRTDTTDTTGAVLVFLPGWDEISKVKDELSRHSVRI